jgi:hypothetical protein
MHGGCPGRDRSVKEPAVNPVDSTLVTQSIRQPSVEPAPQPRGGGQVPGAPTRGDDVVEVSIAAKRAEIRERLRSAESPAELKKMVDGLPEHAGRHVRQAMHEHDAAPEKPSKYERMVHRVSSLKSHDDLVRFLDSLPERVYNRIMGIKADD